MGEVKMVKANWLGLVIAAGLSTPALAAHENLFTNPAFSGDNNYFYVVSNFNDGADRVPGWVLGGYGFLSYPGLATLHTQQYGDQRIAGGPTDAPCAPGSCPNGFVDAPGGYNFIALDGDPTIGSSISQSVTGLTIGSKYAVRFAWAAAQQHNESGPTTNRINVSFGQSQELTAIAAIGSHGFSGWKQETFTFRANATSEVVKFLASGTPVGFPPMALLSGGLSVEVVPEPETWAMFLVGAGAVGIAARRRRTAPTLAS